MKKILKNTYYLFLLGFFSSCSSEMDYSQTRTSIGGDPIIIQGNSATDKEMAEEYEKLITEYQEGLYFRNWVYDEAENNIIVEKKEDPSAFLEGFNHKLGLGFKEHIAKESEKILKLQLVSPFANTEDIGPYAKPLKVNGKVFSGVLIGTHSSSEKRILQVQFYQGYRFGTFKVWSNLGRLHEQFYEDRLNIMDVESVRKPIIYLYPEKEQAINVQVHFDGKLTHTYPKYPTSTGWNIHAKPDGTLTDKATGKEYGYLFWEGNSPYRYNLDKGFVVESTDIASFLDDKLAILGLNRREATDFVSYWLPELEKNPYNLIHFSTDEYEKNAVLEITPKPETLIRIFMVYQPLNNPISIPEQQLTPAKRKGYTVVEWGGKKNNEVLN